MQLDERERVPQGDTLVLSDILHDWPDEQCLSILRACRAAIAPHGRLLIVDCGVLFPEDHHPGVDLILPDFDPIRDRLDAIEALVLTHGHEDHIGAVPYLLRERGDLPLVGSKLTLALLAGKLREHRLKEAPKHEVKEGDRISFGPFELEFVAVNHSIPDALAVAPGSVQRSGRAAAEPIEGYLQRGEVRLYHCDALPEAPETESGFDDVQFAPFEIPIDLPRGRTVGDNESGFEDLNSYTVRSEAGDRLLFRGTLFQPWCHLIARKPA